MSCSLSCNMQPCSRQSPSHQQCVHAINTITLNEQHQQQRQLQSITRDPQVVDNGLL
jgi:hypothetical protein